MENISQSPVLTRNQAAEHLYNTETSGQQVYNMPSQHNDSKFPLPAPKKANRRKQYANMNTLDNNHASANDTELLNHLVPNMNYNMNSELKPDESMSSTNSLNRSMKMKLRKQKKKK